MALILTEMGIWNETATMKRRKSNWWKVVRTKMRRRRMRMRIMAKNLGR